MQSRKQDATHRVLELMVEQCGGRLVLKSKAGRGTTAEIWLRSAKDCSGSDAGEPIEEAATNGSLRILTVDDDAIILLNTATILADMGHEVLQAHSGRSALEVLDKEDVDLMITDFAMPGMTGAELVEKARAQKPSLKVIVASGYVDLPPGTTLNFPRLAKPFTERELAKVISAASN